MSTRDLLYQRIRECGVSKTALEMMKHEAQDLAKRADDFAVPHTNIFHDAEDYPEFDEDAAANYLTGVITGIANAYDLDVVALFDVLLEKEKG